MMNLWGFHLLSDGERVMLISSRSVVQSVSVSCFTAAADGRLPGSKACQC